MLPKHFRMCRKTAASLPALPGQGVSCQCLLPRLQSAEGVLCLAVGEEMRVDELENREYPPAIKAAQIFVTGGTILLFFAVLYWTLQAWAAFLSLFGSYKVESSLCASPTCIRLCSSSRQ